MKRRVAKLKIALPARLQIGGVGLVPPHVRIRETQLQLRTHEILRHDPVG